MKIIISFLCLLLSYSSFSQNTDPIYYAVEDMPHFVHENYITIDHFIREHLVYPESAIKDNIQGNVYVRFVINEEGGLESPEIVQGVREDLDQEVLRIIKIMPAWKPGQQDGEKVKVYYTLPVRFILF